MTIESGIFWFGDFEGGEGWMDGYLSLYYLWRVFYSVSYRRCQPALGSGKRGGDEAEKLSSAHTPRRLAEKVGGSEDSLECRTSLRFH